MDVNDRAPDFSLLDENGKNLTLHNLQGRYVVLYFYPKADTPGCTVEACNFRDTDRQLQEAGAVVLGVSADPPERLKKFKEKYHLSFTLLSDPDKKICSAYDVLKEKNMYGKKVIGIERSTFIIDPAGKIARIYRKVKPEGHAEAVLADLRQPLAS